jgi:hypothetical protein
VRLTAAWTHVVSGVAVTALVAAGAGGSVLAAPAAARLTVRLASVTTLPDDGRAALRSEVERLWARAGVHIQWAEPISSERRDASALQVIVVSRRAVTSSDDHAWPVAELVGASTHRPVAVASLEAAWRVVDAAYEGTEPTTIRLQRLGRVLGRAVAHEIGHHLLGRQHSARGLMRARIDAADFADLRDGGFELDRIDRPAAVRAADGGSLRLASLRARR